MKRDTVLIIISVLFLAISGYIIYTNFLANPSGQSIVLPATTSPSSVANVKSLNNQIESSLKNLRPNGSWDKLESSNQYQSLTPEANIGIDIGVYGQRSNPFLPLATSTRANAK